MQKSRYFQQTLRTSATSISVNEQDEIRQPPQMIRQRKFTKTFAKLQTIPLTQNLPLLNTFSIEHLYLSHNNIVSLKGIEQYPNLVSLNVSYNRLKKITQLRLISNPQKLKRIGVKMNDFQFGWQDFVVRKFQNLKTMDDMDLEQRQTRLKLWLMADDIGVKGLECWIRVSRVVFFMQDLIKKMRINDEMRAKTKHNSLQKSNTIEQQRLFKLLYENMPKTFVEKISSIYSIPTQEQFSHQSTFQILDRLNDCLDVILSESIDLKCTCRPLNLQPVQQISKAFTQITQRFSVKYRQRWNYELDNGMKRLKDKLNQLYGSGQWEKWQCFGLLGNWSDMAPGGKNYHNLLVNKQDSGKGLVINRRDQDKNKQNLWFQKQIKYKSIYHQQFSSIILRLIQDYDKQNISPNVYTIKKGTIENKYYQSDQKELNSPQTDKISLFFDKIPIIVYERNYPEICLQVFMERIKQILTKYDELDKQTLLSKHLHINQNSNQKTFYQKYLKFVQKNHRIQTFDQPYKVKNISSFPFTPLVSNRSETKTKRKKSPKNKVQSPLSQQAMVKSTVVMKSPKQYNENWNENSEVQSKKTITQRFLTRKDSQISFGAGNQQIDQTQAKNEEQVSNKAQKQQKTTDYSIYQINLIYKTFRTFKLRIIKRKNQKSKK